MNQNATPLAVYDGETLMDARLPKRSFCIETLLPEGISMLGGAPKIGKSWMVLDIGLHVAKGIPIWNLPTRKGTVLYLALEDSLFRIQDRLNRLTDEAPGNLFFAIGSLVGLASVMDGEDDNNTSEEIEAEERARLAGENVVAVLELICLGVELSSDGGTDEDFTMKI